MNNEFECITMAYHLTKFVNHFHSKAIIINDIKPSHLFVTAEGRIKMFSFSMSQIFQKRITRSKSAFKGSPYYLAPEVTLKIEPDHTRRQTDFGI